MFVFRLMEEGKHPAVVDISRSNSISADESMVDIYGNTVLVTVVTETVLFVQRVSKSFCCNRSGFSSQPFSFDFVVLFAGIALCGNRDESRINDLTTAAWRSLERRYVSNISKSSSRTPALRSRSLRKPTVPRGIE